MPNNYDVAFAAIRIMDTRSRGNDTLWIKINVAVDDVDKGTVTWDGSFSHEEGKALRAGRDFNNGYFDGI